MATEVYKKRLDIFYGMQRDAAMTLSHPELDAPDHPYIDDLINMTEYAAFGVIDAQNGLVHADSVVFHQGVVLVPVLTSDIKLGRVSIASSLSKVCETEDYGDVSRLGSISAICEFGGETLAPIVFLAPRLNQRSPFLRGLTVVHELDHAYWWWHRRKMHKNGDDEEVQYAELEISANRLEQSMFFAHEPAIYDEEYGKVSQKFADLDFTREYKPRDKDKLRRAARAVAFANFMFDELGADVGIKPDTEVIAALKAQGYI